ncbi:FadR/GntR family transcriptional regulator [Corynebacterium epidermidicanis]|uniref:Transcriptional regulator, GntR family n=1 Tax=Corynebacterium epidermidicanis TaxID=1050174 RepID=A0A0G3GWH0_9CORY|nr:FCD domain-containing protein [Corynebacterium epidermidicanis]AKK03873.1 transcriptional regulator, GntR family [Corynebacterium epidermidicanis]
MSMPMRPHAPLLETVLDHIGLDIVSGKIQTGDKFTLQTLCESFSISRTVARETMRALEHLGMVSSSRRVGITVLPKDQWSVFSESIIRWRLQVPTEREAQLKSLTELRIAVEPQAARITAIAASQKDALEMREIAAQMAELASQGNGATREYVNLNTNYHAMVLRCSGNEMFAALVPAISSVIAGEFDHGSFPDVPSAEVLDTYIALADAIFERNADAAAELTQKLLSL